VELSPPTIVLAVCTLHISATAPVDHASSNGEFPSTFNINDSQLPLLLMMMLLLLLLRLQGS